MTDTPTSPLAMSALLHDLEVVEVKGDVAHPSHKDSALWYARRYRWPVFPIVPRGKKPLTTHGFHEATTDTTQILEWWTRWPDANLGTPTGADGCGYDVVDIDGPVGLASLREFAHELEVKAIAFTPGDGVERKPGRHLFIPATGDGNATKFAAGCDYRGAGGYVVLPPSIALHGVRYQWIEAP